MNPNSHSLWVKIDRYPPVLIRLLARHGSRVMTDLELVFQGKGELTLSDIKRLSFLPSWDTVPVKLMRDFCDACNIDFGKREDMRRLNRYLKSDPKFAHLRKDKNFSEYKQMLTAYYEYETQRAAL